MPAPNWSIAIRSFWVQNIPSPVGGVIPNWGNIVGSVIRSYQAGRIVTLVDGGQQYILTAVTASELRFEGRFAYRYPNNTSATQYIRTVNRSSGAVASHTARFTISNYT